jgi:hypothetical protein
MEGRKSGCAGTGNAIDKAGGVGEGEAKFGLAFCLREVANGEVFGRGGSFSEEVVMDDDDG